MRTRYIADLLDDRCIAEVAGGRITRPAEGRGADMSGFARRLPRA
jgi:hypothetical protein